VVALAVAELVELVAVAAELAWQEQQTQAAVAVATQAQQTAV
jgi:hypothetical protein